MGNHSIIEMKRLVFLVEGHSELVLVHNLIIPHLYSLGFQNPVTAQTIITNRKQHKKGGVINYDYLKNDLKRILSQGNVLATTLVDFFKLPPNFPNYTTNPRLIDQIENGIWEDFEQNPDLIPYIQKHEFEALLFTGIGGFELMIDDDGKLQKIRDIIAQFPNPEDINSSPDKAPSKRLASIYNYDKVADSELIIEMLDIQSVLDKCPRFRNWLNTIVEKLKE